MEFITNDEAVEFDDDLFLKGIKKIAIKYNIISYSITESQNSKESLSLRNNKKISEEDINNLLQIASDDDLKLLNILLKNVDEIEDSNEFYRFLRNNDLDDLSSIIEDYDLFEKKIRIK